MPSYPAPILVIRPLLVDKNVSRPVRIARILQDILPGRYNLVRKRGSDKKRLATIN